MPKRKTDDVGGELFVAAYERALWRFPTDAITYLTDTAIQSSQWFPTVAECLDIVGRWIRDDIHAQRHREARRRLLREKSLRERDRLDSLPPAPRRRMTQDDVDQMSGSLRAVGLRCGALIENPDGTISPNPDDDEEAA